MNKTRLFGIAIVLFSLTVSSLYGQRKEIEQKEYDKLMNEIRENTRNLSHRLITIRTRYRQDGITVQETEKKLSEYVLSGDRRFLSEFVNHLINRTTITELIKINGVEYKKVNNGKWEIVSSRTIIGDKNVKIENEYKNYFLTKNVLLDGQTVDIIESESEDTLKYKNHSNSEIIETHNYRWKWIIKDGLFIKSEAISEKVNPKISISNSTTNYEYDPKIKIEVPIIDEKENP